MQPSPSLAGQAAPGGTRSPSLDHLTHAIQHAAHLLPAQGPITVFIHHNTLHAFEDLPFAETVALRRVRGEVSSAVRAALIAETRRWVMRDLRGGNEAAAGGRRRRRGGVLGLLDRRGEAAIETWGEEEWEGFTLRALWRV